MKFRICNKEKTPLLVLASNLGYEVCDGEGEHIEKGDMKPKFVFVTIEAKHVN